MPAICPPPPCGEGLGVGVVVVARGACPTTTPARLASLATLPTRGRVKTEFAARTDSSSLANGSKRPLAAYYPPGARDGTRALRRRARAPIGPRTRRGALWLVAHHLRAPAEQTPPGRRRHPAP